MLISYYFHTIRHLKAKQIYFRILYNLISPNIIKKKADKLRFIDKKFYIPIEKKVSLSKKNQFNFLNKSMYLSDVGWNGHADKVSKLWRYNQHYFDDLNATGSKKRSAWHNELLNTWVHENKIGEGVGWEPYPTSLRIVNWIKWYFSGNNLSNLHIDNLALQVRWLNKRIEWHILGNHLFSNAKALVFAGLFFSSEESTTWLNKGLKIINDELSIQVLDDGGNFERSPMYHAIFLEDLLDLINISQVYSNVIRVSHIFKWKKKANSMLVWLEKMIHPDGEISFFNDSSLKIAPTFNDLKNYAQRLGIDYKVSNFNKVTYLQDSGYVRVSGNNFVSLLDVAPIGPEYLPGHAHADTLSFEVSLFGQRFIVNSGTSEYEISPIREYERSTKAHNTVVVNDKDSSEVWNSFRVARRAYPFDLKIEESSNTVNISCAHDGYSRLSGKPIHRRSWQFYDNAFIIKDIIDGPFETGNAYFHFHPLLKITEEHSNFWSIKIPNSKKIAIELKLGKAKIEKSYYSPEFGKKLKSQCIKVSLNKNEGSCIQFFWDR